VSRHPEASTAKEPGQRERTATPFHVWATADAHVHTDLERSGRRSLTDAIRHSEVGGDGGAPPFGRDVMLHLGDLCGLQTPPGDAEGPPVLEQFATMRNHRREQVYNLIGNHDTSGPTEATQWWFRKWIDPEGRHPESSGVRNERRPFPIEGSWERYRFQAHNILFLMMSDRNDGGPPEGRGPRRGYPAGRVTLETFRWWREQVEANRDKIIVTCAHHMLRDTTTASGRWEGVDGGYHGRMDDGAPIGASYIYWVGNEADSNRFHDYLDAHPGCIDLWLGAHTHTNPDDRYGGKGLIERRWGVTFVNVAALTLHHARHSVPMSRLLSFSEGSDRLRLRCYLHTDHHAPQGWYPPAERHIDLRHPFVPDERGAERDGS
jgi:hypothetical protein